MHRLALSQSPNLEAKLATKCNTFDVKNVKVFYHFIAKVLRRIIKYVVDAT